MYLLQGLPFEYNAFITNMNSQHVSLEIEKAVSLLLNQDMQIANIIALLLPPYPFANLVKRNSC